MENILHLRVEGIVQGVFYRQNTIKAALDITGLSGWVRNRNDASVEVLAKGKEENLQRLFAWCRQGSPLSTVTAVEELSSEPEALLKLPPIVEGVFKKEDTF